MTPPGGSVRAAGERLGPSIPTGPSSPRTRRPVPSREREIDRFLPRFWGGSFFSKFTTRPYPTRTVSGIFLGGAGRAPYDPGTGEGSGGTSPVHVVRPSRARGRAAMTVRAVSSSPPPPLQTVYIARHRRRHRHRPRLFSYLPPRRLSSHTERNPTLGFSSKAPPDTISILKKKRGCGRMSVSR